MTRPLRVLIVEDVPDDAELMILALQEAGIDPTWERVETADELGAALAAGSWDAVLSDYTIPRFSAIAALEVVRAADPDLPFIVVSGSVGEDVAVGLLRLGANDYVLKQSLTRLAPTVSREIREAGNRRVRRATEQATAHLAAIVESSNDAIIAKTLDGVITTWNPAADRLYGWTAAEAIGRNVSFLVPPEKTAELAEFVGRLRTGEKIEPFESVRLHRDGRRIDVSLTISPIRSADGRLIGLSKISRDIRERKWAERDLWRTTNLLNAVVEGTTDAVYVKDRECKYLLFNEAAARFVGQSAQEVLGKDDTSLFDPIGASRVMAKARSIMESGQADTSEEVLTAAGATRTYQTTQAPYRDEQGAVIGVIGIARDFTERRRLAVERDALLARLQLHIERMPLAYVLLDADLRITDWNPAAEQILGYTRAEALGMGAFDLVTPSFRPEATEILARIRAREMTAHSTNQNVTKDGRTIICDWLNTPLMDPNGTFQGILSLAQDVTARKQAEASLAFSEVRYRRLFEAALDGILIVDPASRQVIDVNPFLTNLIGRTRDEVVGKELWELGLFKDIEANKEAFRTLKESGNIRYDDLPLKTKDGRCIEVEFVSNVYDVGDTQVVQCNVRDVSARKQAEEALQLRDRAIRAVTQGILITDPGQPDNPIIFVSPGFERMTGYGYEEALGRNCRFLQGKDTDPDAASRVREAIHSEQPCTVELLNYRKDGTAFWNELSISPVRDADGRLTHFVGVQADVTERKKLEEQYRQAQKMEAFGQLAGGVAHDFNNLLTVINGYSDMLAEELPSTDPRRDSAVEIRGAGERAAGLTAQLLAFSRKAIVEPKILDLNELVNQVGKMLRRLIGEDVTLSTELSPALRAIKADQGQIEQVIMNLAVNARDAMPKGGRLTIATKNTEVSAGEASPTLGQSPGRSVQLSVSDTGTGMTDEVRTKIFEPFYTTKPVGKGTGLGLATVYGIVKQAEGQIGVVSEVGVGTTFSVTFPAAIEPVSKPVSVVLAPPASGTETVLLVEDEFAVRKFARLALQSRGYKVLEAENGAEAIRIAEEHDGPLQLLLTDVVLPGIGGRDLTEAIRVLRPGVRVLFMSGYTDDAIVRHGVVEATDAFLQKPFAPLALARKVRSVLDEQKA